MDKMDDHEMDNYEIEQGRKMIQRSRESIAETDRHVASSVERLIESQRLVRDIDK